MVFRNWRQTPPSERAVDLGRAKLCCCARLLIKREGLTVTISSRSGLGVRFLSGVVF